MFTGGSTLSAEMHRTGNPPRSGLLRNVRRRECQAAILSEDGGAVDEDGIGCRPAVGPADGVSYCQHRSQAKQASLNGRRFRGQLVSRTVFEKHTVAEMMVRFAEEQCTCIAVPALARAFLVPLESGGACADQRRCRSCPLLDAHAPGSLPYGQDRRATLARRRECRHDPCRNGFADR